ncbi:MAG: asparaginase [Vicinamibacterales bacterium]|nr:asparaginase [Vicinamibacterales bacterium]
MANSALHVDVLRGGLVESRHRVHAVVADAAGRLVWAAGDAGLVTFVRSAIKMFQALPLVEDGGVERYGLTAAEIAITTASHGGEPFHIDTVRALLGKTGCTEEMLACGPHPPMHQASAGALGTGGITPGRIHNNCSGKHAGMLALAGLHGWPRAHYQLLAHPVQSRVLATLAEWTGVPHEAIGCAVDGCGLPTFALPLDAMARGCARLSAAAARGDEAPARVLGAMTAHPEYVAGTDRLCTDLMRAAGGRLWAKVGAEGYYCAGVPDRGLGLALKVEDGAWRAVEPALLAVLGEAGALDDEVLAALEQYATPTITNTRGERVGAIRVHRSGETRP